MKHLFTLMLTVLPGLYLNAQSLLLESGAGIGTVIRHTEGLTYEEGGVPKIYFLKATLDTENLFPWSDNFKNPYLGFEAHILDYNNNVLGFSLALFPSIYFPFVDRDNFNFGFELGSGVSIHSKKYDRTTNPLNNGISKTLNNISKLGFRGVYHFNQKSHLSIQSSLIHNSNGRTSYPNRGINSFMVSGSYLHRIADFSERTIDTSHIRYKKCQLDIGLSYASRKASIPGGPALYHFEANLGLRYLIGSYNYLSLGFATALSEDDIDFLVRNIQVSSREEALRESLRYSIYVSDEILLGKVGIGLVAGTYIFTKYKPWIIYEKLYCRYHFGKHRSTLRPYLGVELKAHLFTAEYIGLRMGVTLQ